MFRKATCHFRYTVSHVIAARYFRGLTVVQDSETDAYICLSREVTHTVAKAVLSVSGKCVQPCELRRRVLAVLRSSVPVFEVAKDAILDA